MQPGRAHVVGLARSGMAAIRLLLRNGWQVVASDSKYSSELNEKADEIRKLGAEVFLAGHKQALEYSVDLAVVSPGVPPYAEVLVEISQLGLNAISEVELGWMFAKGKIAAITGSNGKSTTTALLGEIFRQTGKSTFVCGNIGLAMCEIADQTEEDSLIALELSSYQLERTQKFKPQTAAILSYSPDHLDWHGSEKAYKTAKMKIWKNMSGGQRLINYWDDPGLVDMMPDPYDHSVTALPFSLSEPLTEGAWLVNDYINVKVGNSGSFQVGINDIALRGSHNIANAMAAILLALECGVSENAIRRGLKEFRGLPHRLELIAVKNGVTYINDSKATNVDAGMTALQAMERPTVLLIGGRPKSGGFKAVSKHAAIIKQVITFGEASSEIERDLSDDMEVMLTDTIDQAIAEAKSIAQPGDVVLLSPMCASFDQFKDYEQRGDVFRQLVESIE
ncbi:UDP-N-acetylmuramoyl-L-alanine--D-glutamate ligase [Calditrichota bacterium]